MPIVLQTSVYVYCPFLGSFRGLLLLATPFWPEVEVPGIYIFLKSSHSLSLVGLGKQQRWLEGDAVSVRLQALQVPGALVVTSFDVV